MRIRVAPSGPFADIPTAGNLSVVNPAALTPLPDDTDTPDLVWVLATRCYWHRNRTSTLAADGITVVAATAGRWERMIETTSPSWGLVPNWYINPATGSDVNDGETALTALATADELDRRLSTGPIRQDTRLNLAWQTYARIELNLALDGWLFQVAGHAETTSTGTVTTYVDRVHDTYPNLPTPPTLQDALRDWTGSEGVRVRLTSGASIGAIAWTDRVNPGGAGTDFVSCSRFGAPPSPTAPAGSVVPAPGDQYAIDSLTVVESMSLRQRDIPAGIPSAQAGSFVVTDCEIGTTQATWNPLTIDVPGEQYFLVDGCRIDSKACFPSSGDANHRLLTRCKFGGPSGDTIASLTGACTLDHCIVIERMLVQTDAVSTVVTAGYFSEALYGLGALPTQPTFQQWHLSDVQFWRQAAGGMFLQNACEVYVKSGLSGVAAPGAWGLQVSDLVSNRGGQSLYWEKGSEPNLQDSTGIACIGIAGGLGSITLNWTDVRNGWHSDEQAGTAPLVAGTVIIPARNGDIRHPQVWRDTPGGNPIGTELTVPVATVTPTQFVVNAVDSAGVLVNTDTSTVRWRIPPMARQVTLSPGNAIT